MFPTVGNAAKRSKMYDIIRSELFQQTFHLIRLEQIHYMVSDHNIGKCRKIKRRRLDIYAAHVNVMVILLHISKQVSAHKTGKSGD